MRKLLAIGLVVMVLALGLTLGGSHFATFSGQAVSTAHQLVSLSGPDGPICGGTVSTWC